MSFVISELKHIKSHWLSCLLSCVIVHVAFDIVEHVFEYFTK